MDNSNFSVGEDNNNISIVSSNVTSSKISLRNFAISVTCEEFFFCNCSDSVRISDSNLLRIVIVGSR